MNHFSTGLWCVKKTGFYMTTSNDKLVITVVGLRRSFKALPKDKYAPKWGHGHYWWSTTSFWILIKPLHQRSMLSKSMRCTKTYNSWSWHWSTELAQFFSVTAHNMLHNQSFKDWTNWATKFCLICHIHLTSQQSTTTSSSISTILLQRKCLHNQKGAENVSKSSLNHEAQIFMLQE